MKYLSTFSGIGGFEIGIDKAFKSWTGEQSGESGGVDIQRPGAVPNDSGLHPRLRTGVCIGYSEVDSHAIKTYEEHYDHTNYGDITAIDAESLPDFDLIVGGFPCQAFSVAGKRRGFDETRGTLFFDLARILKHKRPGHFVFENVKGLLSHDGGKTIQTIAGVLSDLGYRVEWQVLNSKDFGVPQNRERIYIVGHLRDRCSRQVLPIVNGRGADIIQLNQPVHSNSRVYGSDGVSPTLNTMQGGLRQPFVQVKETIGNTPHTIIRSVAIRTRTYANQPAQLEVRKDELSNTISTVYKDYMATDSVRVRRLTPTECHRLQGFPDGWCVGSDSQQYKQLGNAVTTNVVEAVMLRLKECLK